MHEPPRQHVQQQRS